jgi:hypothetical protein
METVSLPSRLSRADKSYNHKMKQIEVTGRHGYGTLVYDTAT